MLSLALEKLEIVGIKSKQCDEKNETNMKMLDVIIVGGGAAGIGMANVLKDLGIDSYVVLEQGTVGASFQKWSKGMRFITPSFTSNNFGSPDLNAITYNTSPAYTLKSEHPTGEEYSHYLRGVVKGFDLHVVEETEVFSVKKVSAGFVLDTSRGEMTAKLVVWAAGEFFYPKTDSIVGQEHTIHNSQVEDWKNLEGDEFTILGDYESGIDAAFHLTKLGKKVRVYDVHSTWEETDSDPSISLSPFTLQRIRKATQSGNLELNSGLIFARVEKNNGHYLIRGEDLEQNAVEIISPTKPILATGFAGSLAMVKDLFEFDEEGKFALLKEESDESTITEGLYLVGSQVKHGEALFCFIYKFRQRFAVVGKSIGEYLKIDTVPLEEYRRRGMYLDDLSCCRDQCEC
jgi:putative flavoprotein involved in K+ transport